MGKKRSIDILAFLRNEWFIDWLREDIKTRDFAEQARKKQALSINLKQQKGKFNKKKVLTKQQKRKIKTMWDRGVPYSRIAKELHIGSKKVKEYLKEVEDGRKNRS